MAYYMNRRQLSEIDPSWDYDNEEGTMGLTAGFYYWPDDYQLPVGPYGTLEAAKLAEHRFNLVRASAREYAENK